MKAKKKVDWWVVILALSFGVLSFVQPHLMREYLLAALSLVVMALARDIKNSILMLTVIIIFFVIAMVCVFRIMTLGG